MIYARVSTRFKVLAPRSLEKQSVHVVSVDHVPRVRTPFMLFIPAHAGVHSCSTEFPVVRTGLWWGYRVSYSPTCRLPAPRPVSRLLRFLLGFSSSATGLGRLVNTNRNFECRLKHDKTTVVRTRVLFLCTCQRVGSDSSDLSITFLEVFSSFEPLYLPGTWAMNCTVFSLVERPRAEYRLTSWWLVSVVTPVSWYQLSDFSSDSTWVNRVHLGQGNVMGTRKVASSVSSPEQSSPGPQCYYPSVVTLLIDWVVTLISFCELLSTFQIATRKKRSLQIFGSTFKNTRGSLRPTRVFHAFFSPRRHPLSHSLR